MQRACAACLGSSFYLMAMACRHTGQRKVDNLPEQQQQQQQEPQSVASSTATPARDIVRTDERAEAEAMADEDIGFALHWRCKVVSNVKGSRPVQLG